MGLRRLIKNAVTGIVRWAASDVDDDLWAEAPKIAPASSKYNNRGNTINENANGMNFIIYAAAGGKVVQFSSYNPRTDMHRSELYIVTDAEDLGEELNQIITRESLTRCV